MIDYKEIENLIEQVCEDEDVDIDMAYVIPDQSIENKIKEAEEILNVKLPKSYLWFLKNYGSGGLGDFDYFGIECDRDDVKMYTLVYLTMEYREKGLKESLVVIEDNGDYLTCIDTSIVDQDGESPIVTWSWLDDGEIISKSTSFGSYFLEKLEDYI